MSDKTEKLIGGMFGLHAEPDQFASSPPFLAHNPIYMINGRSAIWLLTKQFKPKQVWCPSYLCPSILEGISEANTPYTFYEVDHQLMINSDQWLEKVHEGDLVIFIAYFGFNQNLDFMAACKERGAIVLQDASQAFLTEGLEENSDFIIFCNGKFVGTPDGGILCRLNNELPNLQFARPPYEWWHRAFLASILRREFDLTGKGKVWFEIFQQTDMNQPIGMYSMSELSQLILNNNVDYSQISRIRKENYQYLLSQLDTIALFPNLPENVVPLGFPIRIKNRDRVQKHLFTQKIYPPIHWDFKGSIPDSFKESHKLSSEIMTLPCDQRLDIADMQRIVNAVKNGLSH